MSRIVRHRPENCYARGRRHLTHGIRGITLHLNDAAITQSKKDHLHYIVCLLTRSDDYSNVLLNVPDINLSILEPLFVNYS